MADEKEKKVIADDKAKTEGDKKPAAKAPAKKTDAKAEKKSDAKAEKKSDAKAEKKTEATGEKKAEAKAEKKSDAKGKTEAKAKGGRAKKSAVAKTAAKQPAKPEAPAELVMVRATARYVRSSPRKARLVVDHIRGDTIADARTKLQFIARHIARDVAKVLESAVANAEHNHELDADDLRIAIAYVDEGPTLKRWRPRARGRASQILKRTSHITVVVSNGTADQISKFSSRKAAA
jgi:ribosomal protein L22